MTAKEYNENVTQWSGDLYRFAWRLCSDEQLSEDIVQEAFAALWESREQVELRKGRPFLFAVAYKKGQDVWRRRYKELGLASAVECEAVCQPAEGFDLREAMEQALQGLTVVQRAVVELHDVQGYSHQEISNILMISDQQARTYLFRARVALKKRLTYYGYDQ